MTAFGTGSRGGRYRVLLTLPDAQSWPLYARLREVIAQDSRDRSTPG